MRRGRAKMRRSCAYVGKLGSITSPALNATGFSLPRLTGTRLDMHCAAPSALVFNHIQLVDSTNYRNFQAGVIFPLRHYPRCVSLHPLLPSAMHVLTAPFCHACPYSLALVSPDIAALMPQKSHGLTLVTAAFSRSDRTALPVLAACPCGLRPAAPLLAEPDRKASQWPAAGPFLCDDPRQAAGDC